MHYQFCLSALRLTNLYSFVSAELMVTGRAGPPAPHRLLALVVAPLPLCWAPKEDPKGYSPSHWDIRHGSPGWMLESRAQTASLLGQGALPTREFCRDELNMNAKKKSKGIIPLSLLAVIQRVSFLLFLSPML